MLRFFLPVYAHISPRIYLYASVHTKPSMFSLSLWKWVSGMSNEAGSCPLVSWEISQQESELISSSLTPSQWWASALDHAPCMLHGYARTTWHAKPQNLFNKLFNNL